MKVDVRALALTAGLAWGGGILLAGMLNLAWPGYAEPFLASVASLYPGYDAGRSAGQVVLGTVYGFADGAVFGLIGGAFYNAVAGTVPSGR